MVTYTVKQEGFKLIDDFYPSRTCWEKCLDCRLQWHETGTNEVHYVIQDNDKKGMFICDHCLSKNKANA